MKKKELCFIGLVLAMLGTFLPLINVPFVGSVNFYSNGNSSLEGIAVIALCLITGFLIYKGSDYFKGAVVSSAVLLVVVAGDLILTFSKIQKIKSNFLSEMQGNPFLELGEGLMNSAGISWGWAILVIGAGMAFYCCLELEKEKKIADEKIKIEEENTIKEEI
ncbi:hypothetical protein A2U16_10085 [Fusobacterium necrophorum subsp. funduliforme]|uniref:hypothetical protein n=1 Tax=Fusobacterium necrophorum TaxID=859 RepID=UPI000786A2A1|nr:hypothetical protein [Fusobacterium necrophorum]KYM65710.1 hypothetical protein A2U16_10085 [Fusobacterium necrophorum subsp. funduliforme]